MNAPPLSRLPERPPFTMRLAVTPTGLLWAPVAALAAAAPAYFAFEHKPVSGGIWAFACLLASHWLGLLLLVVRQRRGPLRDRGGVLSSFVLTAAAMALVAIAAVAIIGPPGSWALAPLILGIALIQGVLSGVFTAIAAFGEATNGPAGG